LPDEVERNETRSDRSGAGAIEPPSRGAPSAAILGADALLAAQPATAVQLAHACLRVGYQAVVPASWGDELVAGGCLKQIASRRSDRDTGPVIFCTCPYVAHRLLAVGPDLAPFLASFVAPPVAVARYLRTLYSHARYPALRTLEDLPVLLISGDKDMITPLAHSEEIARLLPRARYVKIPNSGHVVMLECADEVNEAVKQFLEQW
jgi:pimeloyl-ACP methyl ester carboxylesterase